MKKRNIAIFLIISILVILGIVKKIQNIYEFPYLYVISDDKNGKHMHIQHMKVVSGLVKCFFRK